MISFILTVLNRPDNLGQFFQYMPLQKEDHEWIIVDNASDEQTKQLEYWLVSTQSNITLVENTENKGFGPGNNIGAEFARGDILVFTQPDVRFTGDVTSHLSLLPNTLYGHQLLNYDTGWNRFGSVVVPYLTGYFIACVRSTWDTLGGFDPIYWPADFEDVDLSYAASQKGMSLKAIGVPISHAHFGSTWAQFPNREEVTKRNRVKFALKWNFEIEPSMEGVR